MHFSEIRLRLISDLQENYKLLVNVHELLCISVYGGSQVRIGFCATLVKFRRPQEVDRCPFMINIVTLNLKIARQRGTNVPPHFIRPQYSCK